MAKSRNAAATPAIAVLSRERVWFVSHPYTHDPAAAAYGQEAAEALDVPPNRVFKTLVASVDGHLCVGVIPVDRSLDLKALAAAAGGKRATMADPADAERATGYVRGGISPLGQRRRLRTVLDSSALEHESVFVSGGRRGLDVELSPVDLVRLTDAVTAPVARRR